MKVKFTRQIRLNVKLDCYSDGSCVSEQEWEFDKDEEIEVVDVIYGNPRKFKSGGKKAKVMRYADIFLPQGREQCPDYISSVSEDLFDIVD